MISSTSQIENNTTSCLKSTPFINKLRIFDFLKGFLSVIKQFDAHLQWCPEASSFIFLFYPWGLEYTYNHWYNGCYFRSLKILYPFMICTLYLYWFYKLFSAYNFKANLEKYWYFIIYKYIIEINAHSVVNFIYLCNF